MNWYIGIATGTAVIRHFHLKRKDTKPADKLVDACESAAIGMVWPFFLTTSAMRSYRNYQEIKRPIIDFPEETSK